NIFLTDKDDALDHVKILDFGISRFLAVEDGKRQIVMGTPEFMAPEQVTAPESVDRRADIYALGVILYEMLTARRPFSNEDDPRELLNRISTYPPPPLQRPEVPPGLQVMILEKLLAKNPDDRYQSMAEVQAALEQLFPKDAAPRRSTPIVVDVARDSSLIPRPANVMDTPLPGTLPVVQPPAKPYALYALAGCGILVGVLGLAFGLKGHGVEKAPPPPMPVAQPAAAAPAPREAQKISVTLEADAPNARVVFRRRVASAPATMSIGATDVVELVEVSAPGYKTQRYWLTFDRPTHLKAHLAKGTGMAEATEEETLVALGEVAPPTTPAVAAAAPAAPAMTVARPAQVAAAAPAELAPRKIGRGAADDAPPAELPAIEMTTEARAEQPAAPAANPVAAVEAPKPADVPAPPAPPAVEDPPIVPEPARPAIDGATVSSVIGAHRPEVLKCFADGKKQDRAMKGTLSLQLAVDAGGKVKHIQVQSTLNNPLVAACVVRSANAWTFPTRDGSDVATVNYPFTIN
ncbi:MAG: AgmX/PglI C-terminal domain-containing protein, partial [Deltaproteobacteria bacterium]|nr:AgmX/PglI C-terminal domain-containing protein [Deltaproteobacteria bacterium]